MAQKLELKLEEVRKHPADFMYVFATDEFLNLIPQKYANIIRGKKLNQKKLLVLSADEYLGSIDRYPEYVQAVREGFEEIYGMSPAQALEKLALGQEVAGKNWSEGVYGIGKLHPTTFGGVTIDGQEVTVDKTTGHIFVGTTDITDTSKTQYGYVKKQVWPVSLFSYEKENTIFETAYYKTGKYYYASRYSVDGVTKSARSGSAVSASEAASVWSNIQLGFTDFVSWIKSLLEMIGIKLPSIEIGKDIETINADNTLPNQKTDGFVTEAGIGEAGAILLALAGGGLLLANAKKKKSK